MENVTIKSMINNSNIPASLIRAVVRQFGGFDSFKESTQDVNNHGISGGFHGFIYYSDTCAFYARNRKDIGVLCRQMADELDEGLIEMINDFNCLRLDSCENYLEEIGKTLYGNKSQHDTQVANALAWFAGEEVCRLYCDLLEQ